jgi:serine/threonine-protein kinase
MALTAGTRLGPYEILSALGAGGMGEVYRARDTRLGREVAIKVLPAGVSSDPDRLRRFEQEARAASALNHPNILTIYDVGTHSGSPYVVSELLDGGTLRERISGAALPARRVIDYGLQIAHGLGAAHEKGIVHRDLKPENLFVTKDERVKILDFGLAKLTQPERAGEPATKAPTQTAGTEPGVVMGTVGYMSPEQVRGVSVDHRSDIFSFGAILYEMLTGRRAFRGDSAADTMSAILREEPPPAGTNREIPPSLERTVRHCLEKSPQARFQAARDVAFAIEEASGAPGSAASAGAAAPAGRRRVARFAAIGAFLAAVIVIAALAVRPLRERLFRGAASGPIQSIAVLPLENFSHDPEQEYFADGMTEELITNLAQIGSLRVISRTSAMAYKGTKKRVPEIGRELNVDAVLEGSVQRAGQRVRITAQLVRVATDQHLWARSYERDLKDVLGLQSDVAQAVAREVRAAVTPEERARLARARPVDPEVHELYLQGRQHVSMSVEKELRSAIALFERGLAKDPNDARCWAGLADAWAGLSDLYLPPMEAMPKAREAAQKALRLDDSLSDAHASLGFVYTTYDWKWAEAEEELRRALELNPGYAVAHDWYGWLLAALGRRTECSRESRLARELDPLSPMLQSDAGWVAMVSRQPDEAIGPLRRAIEIEPAFGLAHATLAIVNAQKGLRSDALAEARKAQEVDHSLLVLAMTGGAIAIAGDKTGAREVLERLKEISKTRYVCPYEVGVIYVCLGEKDEAFRWLEKGYEARSACMPFTKVDPRLDPIRSDPRYADLLRRLAFPP